MAPIQNQPAQFCASCGLPLTTAVHFCPRCGQPIQDTGAPAPSVSSLPVSPLQAPAPPKRQQGRSGCLGYSLIALVIFGFILAIGYEGAREQQASIDAKDKVQQYVEKRAQVQKAAATYEVEYWVVAGEQFAFSATYTNAEGGTEQANHVFAHEDPTGQERGPNRLWIKKLSARHGDHLYISAQNSDGRSGADLVVFIRVNNKLVRKSDAYGPYAIAQCNYTIPD